MGGVGSYLLCLSKSHNIICSIIPSHNNPKIISPSSPHLPFKFPRLDSLSVRLSLSPPPADKTKESALATPKPLQPGLHPSLGSAHHGVPGLVPAHGIYLGPPGAHGPPGVLTAAAMLQQRNEEERWLARQRKLRQEKEDRQYQVSEFRQQVLEQHLDLGRPGEAADMRMDGHR